MHLDFKSTSKIWHHSNNEQTSTANFISFKQWTKSKKLHSIIHTNIVKNLVTDFVTDCLSGSDQSELIKVFVRRDLARPDLGEFIRNFYHKKYGTNMWTRMNGCFGTLQHEHTTISKFWEVKYPEEISTRPFFWPPAAFAY